MVWCRLLTKHWHRTHRVAGNVSAKTAWKRGPSHDRCSTTVGHRVTKSRLAWALSWDPYHYRQGFSSKPKPADPTSALSGARPHRNLLLCLVHTSCFCGPRQGQAGHHHSCWPTLSLDCSRSQAKDCALCPREERQGRLLGKAWGLAEGGAGIMPLSNPPHEACPAFPFRYASSSTVSTVGDSLPSILLFRGKHWIALSAYT